VTSIIESTRIAKKDNSAPRLVRELRLAEQSLAESIALASQLRVACRWTERYKRIRWEPAIQNRRAGDRRSLVATPLVFQCTSAFRGANAQGFPARQSVGPFPRQLGA